MFAIDGQQRRTMPACRVRHQRACGDQRFLVREGDRPARFDRSDDRPQARATDDRCDDEVCVTLRHLEQRVFSRRCLAIGATQSLLQLAELLAVRDDRQLRTGAPRDFGKGFDIGCRAHGDDFEPLRRALD